MKQCMGRVPAMADQRAYKENIQKVIRFLNGDFQETIDQLTEKCRKHLKKCALRMLQKLEI